MSDQPPPEHWPTERMIAEGHADYAVKEDLEGLDEQILCDIAELCEVDEFAPDECIPCLAHTIVLERRKQAIEQALPHNDAPFPEEASELDVTGEEVDVNDPEQWVEVSRPEEKPVVERFAEQVKTLSGLVEELLEGPPIPPPNVTMDELALLAVAAQRWVNTTEAAGFELAPKQEQVLEATKALLARLNNG